MSIKKSIDSEIRNDHDMNTTVHDLRVVSLLARVIMSAYGGENAVSGLDSSTDSNRYGIGVFVDRRGPQTV